MCAYVPPHKRAQQADATDLQGEAVQKSTWEALRKHIHGIVNRVSVETLADLVPALIQGGNLIRGRGLLARAVVSACVITPSYVPVYSALIAALNPLLPEIGSLVARRAVRELKRGMRKRDRRTCAALATFAAALTCQGVLHELLSLQLLMLWLATPTDDSVQLALDFADAVMPALLRTAPAGVRAIMDKIREVLREGTVSGRVQFSIEHCLKSWGTLLSPGSELPPFVANEYDITDRSQQITHTIALDDTIDAEDALDTFRLDTNFQQHEAAWADIRADLLGEDDEEDEEDEEEGASEAEEGELDSDDAAPLADGPVLDLSEQAEARLKSRLYQIMTSSISHDEVTHKIMSLQLPPERIPLVVNMIVRYGIQEHGAKQFLGGVAHKLCCIDSAYRDAFEVEWASQYATIHQLDTKKIYNIASLFAFILASQALPWTVFEFVRITAAETTSAARVFLKVVLQRLAEACGMKTLLERFNDPGMAQYFEGMFPTDSVDNMRYAINFYTAIGLGALSVQLREQEQQAGQRIAQSAAALAQAERGRSRSRSYSSRSRSGSYSSRSRSGSYSSRSRSGSYSSRSRSGSYSSRSRSRSYSSRSRSCCSRSRSKSSSPRQRAAAPRRSSSSRSHRSNASRSASRSASPPRHRRPRSASPEARRAESQHGSDALLASYSTGQSWGGEAAPGSPRVHPRRTDGRPRSRSRSSSGPPPRRVDRRRRPASRSPPIRRYQAGRPGRRSPPRRQPQTNGHTRGAAPVPHWMQQSSAGAGGRAGAKRPRAASPTRSVDSFGRSRR